MSYEVWTDAYNKLHEISKMDESYIINCIKQLELMAGTWRYVKITDLTKSEKKDADLVGSKAWFVEHGKSFIRAFKEELVKREKEEKSK